jgi:hypothetical protein
MPDTTVTLIVAAFLFVVALFAWLTTRAISRRIGAITMQLRAADERLVNERPLLAGRMGAQRANLAELSAASERALWSLTRFDERLDTVRAGLVTRRIALNQDRTRLIAAHATLIRARRTAQRLIKMMELRRAITG